MSWVSDDAVARLRGVAELPDFDGTRYELVREVGRGGMGVVYEALDRQLDRHVAIKVLATELASPQAAGRMRREARVIAGLEHPGIVPLHDVGTLADGRIFYAMKLVRGRRLDQLSREERGATELLRIFLRVCEAVALAHARGVVHCDLKPENVMAGEFGEVLVMDWGVARALGDPGDEHVIAGTRGFMAPEQERGGAVTPASDVYALGAMLRALLPKAPRLLNAIVAKATAPNRHDRYRDAGELGDDVVRYLDGAPLAAYRENAFERAGRWLARNRALAAVIVSYLIMRAMVLFFAHR